MKAGFFICCVLLASLFIFDDLSMRQIVHENPQAQTMVCESPGGGCDQKLINVINNAHKYVYFAVYTITKQNIADALIAAKLRGVDVQGILDYNQSIIPEEKPIVTRLKKYGLQLKIPIKESGLIHIKMLVTESAYASGSFNWTTSATNYNDEVLEIGSVEGLRKKYLSVWEKINKKY